ncbi:MAG: quinone-dependent dihydroorotate dehydrogenase [Bacteroidales bacterium]|nr:quinone-dependent dihydroorotate dehydrogenase [Bacteroidales bacterium]
MNPESAHRLSFKGLEILRHIPGAIPLVRMTYCYSHPSLRRDVFGVTFKNPVGISAGVDCDALFYNDLGNFGPGFVEVGTLTIAPQKGNEKPRWLRLKGKKAFVNNYGHANQGVRKAISNIQGNHPREDLVVIANIGKNNDTPAERAVEDIDRAYTLIYDFSDIVVVNMLDTDMKYLAAIIDRITTVRRYNDNNNPILIKLPPDISREQIDIAIHTALSYGIDGLVVSGSTYNLDDTGCSMEHGELTGAPVFEHSLETLKYVYEKSQRLIPIIVSGGISTPEQAQMMLDSGASLIEVHTALAYEGPSLIKKILKHLVAVDRKRHPEKYTKKKRIRKEK